LLLTALSLAACGDGDRTKPDMGPCTGLACFQVDCGSAVPRTSVSGKVFAPNGIDPVHDALVYVPSSMDAFSPTVQCEVCSEPTGGKAIVSTRTAVDGSFTLSDVPVTSNAPLVIQKGRFRRVVHFSAAQCVDNPLTADVTRLPKNQSEGDLPKMAVGVGDYDQIECVLRSIGIDDAEFTDPTGPGAVHLYQNGASTANTGMGNGIPDLLADSGKMAGYALTFLNCTGNTWDKLPNPMLASSNLYNYVSSGGRLYVTDWSYDYLEQVPQFAPYIYFEGGGSMTMPQPVHGAATASLTNPFPATITDNNLAAWLALVAPSQITNSQVQIGDLLAPWVLVSSTASSTSTTPSTTWVHGVTNGGDRPLSVTFDYNSCGKVLFSSYHTREPGGAGSTPFPAYCKSSPTMMTAQEKILEYLILQITDCVGPVM
jgi:hypothetical protein